MTLNESSTGDQLLTVIVPVYQDWADALELVECLRGQTLDKRLWTAVFVDNGSDNIPDVTALPGFISVIRCETPGSYAARNTALQIARGEYVVFTDADCRPVPQWLEQLVTRFKCSDEPDLVAGAVEVKKLTPGSPNDYELYDIALGLPQARYVSRGYAVTANLAVKKGVFDAVGDFDASRFSGGDAEFCQRAVSKGHSLIIEESAVVHHPTRSDWEQLERKARRVKGGQIRNGPFKRRAKFLVRTFLPPVFAFMFAMRCDQLSRTQRLKVCAVQVRIWCVEMVEVFRLVAGAAPERR